RTSTDGSSTGSRGTTAERRPARRWPQPRTRRRPAESAEDDPHAGGVPPAAPEEGVPPTAVIAPHSPIAALLAELHASRGGLTSEEARRRLDAAGPNEPARAPRTAGLAQILLLLANPLVIILLIASAASAILGERVNASIIVLMVVLSVVLNFVQTYRSHRIAERLRDAVAPTATVLRDGTWSEIRRRDLVPGDIVR